MPYQYVPANYDIYLEQMQKKQEVAAQKAANRQAIIQKMYNDVIVGDYYNMQMRDA